MVLSIAQNGLMENRQETRCGPPAHPPFTWFAPTNACRYTHSTFFINMPNHTLWLLYSHLPHICWTHLAHLSVSGYKFICKIFLNHNAEQFFGFWIKKSLFIRLEHMYKCTFFVESVVLWLHLCRAPGCRLWSVLLMGLNSYGERKI